MSSKPRTPTVLRYDPPKPGEPLGHYVVRLPQPDGRRPVVHMPPTPDTPAGRADMLAKAADLIAELWRSGKNIPAQRGPKRPKWGTPYKSGFETWFEAWIEDRKARGYTSTRENESHYREHIAPVLPEKHVRDWTADDMRALVNALDEKVRVGTISWKTASNAWGTATKMCKDACASKRDALRVRTDNPSAGVQGPDRGAVTAKQYLWPSEFLQLVECENVSLRWRRLATLAVYMFPRASELRMLRWEDIDLVHGTVHIHRSRNRNTGAEKSTKTRHARRFNIEPALLPLLRTMHAESDGSGLVVEMYSERNMAEGLRRCLRRAGVNRAELHESTPTRKAMTWHDLRSTGITWMAVRGDEPLKIQQRAGHTDFQTTQGYIREAEAVRHGFDVVCPELPVSQLCHAGL